jgi:methyltransferase-like protein
LLSKLNNSVKAGDKLRRHVRYFKFKEDMLDLYSVLNDDVDFLSIEHKHILSLIDACNSITDIKNFINKIKLEEIEESTPKIETLIVEVEVADSKNINNGNITSKVETLDIIKPIVVYFNYQQDRDLVANFIKEKFKASKINDKIVPKQKDNQCKKWYYLIY